MLMMLSVQLSIILISLGVVIVAQHREDDVHYGTISNLVETCPAGRVDLGPKQSDPLDDDLRSMCVVANSCLYRCGTGQDIFLPVDLEKLPEAKFCSCDQACIVFKDCCKDFKVTCPFVADVTWWKSSPLTRLDDAEVACASILGLEVLSLSPKA